MVDYQDLKLEFDLENRQPGGRIGLMLLGTDLTSEQELRQMLPEGIEVFTNRVQNQNPLTLENLRKMEQEITRAAAGILPGRGVDVMIFGCTSGSAAIGDDTVEALAQIACPNVPVTNPLRAASAAMKALGKTKLSVLTPYIPSVSEKLVSEFNLRGLETVSLCGLNMEDDIDIACVPMETIIEAAEMSIHDDAEALFISCTALRAAQVVQELEEILRKPVLTSNQVMTWHALRLMGYQDAIEGFGKLMRVGMA